MINGIGSKTLIILALLFGTLKAQESARPFSLSGTYLDIQRANSKEGDFNLHYAQSDIAFAYTYPFNSCNGLLFGAGWVGSTVEMIENPLFDESNFNYATLSLGGFTHAMPDWNWTFTLSIFLDAAQLDLSHYSLYQGVLWGKYHLLCNLELDLGFITEVGLNRTKMWPILGFAYSCSKRLRLNAIYPIRVGIEYDLLRNCTFGAHLRFLRNRHRVASNNPLPEAIFEYTSLGAEADLSIAPYDWLFVKGFVGTTLGSNLKVTNRDYHDAIYFRFQRSFYLGASGGLKF